MSFFDSLKNKASKLVKEAVSAPGTKKVTLSSIPVSAEEMQAMPEFTLKDPFYVSALTVAALNVYPVNQDSALEMLKVLKGPQELSTREVQFIRDRFMDGKDYLPRSYFDGATPDNNYEPTEPYTVSVKEQSNSREVEGIITLYLTSGGADSPRPIQLRNKPSTGEWFLWSYEGLLSGIRIPKASDPWA